MNNISLYWYSYPNLIPNIGDYLGKYIVESISEKKVTYTEISNNFPKYASIGSIINKNAGKNTTFWGSGIKSEKWVPSIHSEYLAVRGPLTYRQLSKYKINCPKIFGDPALLLPLILENPNKTKRYKIGIIPHYFDEEHVRRDFENADIDEATIISCVTDDVRGFIENISQCECIVSSSLHGVIISHAYGIPALWMRFSEDDRIGSSSPFKFHDYFLSCGIEQYTPPVINPIKGYCEILKILKEYEHLLSINNFNILPLIESCPFSNSFKKYSLKSKAASYVW
jgi:pyruvyltransferase